MKEKTDDYKVGRGVSNMKEWTTINDKGKTVYHSSFDVDENYWLNRLLIKGDAKKLHDQQK